jgi:hypothetical protein
MALTPEQGKRVQDIARQGVHQMVDALLAMIAEADPTNEEEPSVIASVFVHSFFQMVDPIDSDTALRRAVKDEIIERVFPSTQR